MSRKPVGFLTELYDKWKRQNHNTGRKETQDTNTEHTSAHKLQDAAKIPQVVFSTQTSRWYIISSQNSANLITLHWWHLIYNYSMSPRRNPGSLVNILQFAQGDRLGPGRWPAGATTVPMPTSVRDNPVHNRIYHNYSPPMRSF